MTQHPPDNHAVEPPRPTFNALLFWLLSAAGLLLAIPCLLLPPIEAYRALSQLERYEDAITARLAAKVADQEVLSEALRRDPQVNLRLAQRELSYRPAGHLASVPPPSTDPASTAELLPRGSALPRWVLRLYPPWWSRLCKDREFRTVLLLSSVALVVFAAAACGPDSRQPVRRR